MKDFAAIDFETANGNRSSVCSVGVVIVRGGAVTDRIYRLIRPAPNYYSDWTTDIHGLCYCDTADSAKFPEIWDDISPIIVNLPLIAHNSSFDENCLRRVHEYYGMEYPEYDFMCSCRMARRAFPELRDHKLKTVAQHIGFDLTNHHHALVDAEACAEIILKIWRK